MLRVLIVDDSGFARRRIAQVLAHAPDIQVVGEAADGQSAVHMAQQLQPDLVTMDYEMPGMNGISALLLIRQLRPVPIIMISSLTFAGARVTLQALEAGAADFIVKNQIEARQGEEFLLLVKIRALCQPKSAPAPVTRPAVPAPAGRWQPRLIIIGASTGGPPIIRQILSALPSNFAWPVLVVQHMPERFTRALAERLQDSGPLPAEEATDMKIMQPGHVYVAAGGRQLLCDAQMPLRMKVVEDGSAQLYRPSLDLSLGSAAKALGAAVLALVLTGMGDDGVRGARWLRRAGGRLWVQDAQSCVVNGMPQAMRDAGLVDAVLTPQEMGQRLARQQW